MFPETLDLAISPLPMDQIFSVNWKYFNIKVLMLEGYSVEITEIYSHTFDKNVDAK